MILHRRILGTPEITFPPNYVQDTRSRVYIARSAGGWLSLTLGCGVCARPKSSVSIKKYEEKNCLGKTTPVLYNISLYIYINVV